MSLCRECEVVLWRRHEACPCCLARRPAVRVRPGQPSPVRRVGRAVSLAATGPAALVADLVLRRLVG